MRCTVGVGSTGTVSSMFGYIKKSDVERLLRQVVQDMRKTDPEYLREVRECILEIVRKKEAAAAQQADQAKPALPEAQKRPENHTKATP